MNRIHRKIWNAHRGAYVAVAETTRSRGKSAGTSGALVAGVLLAVPFAALAGQSPGALPTGGQVSVGSASIATQGNAMTITQTGNRTAIDWQSFNIGSGASVQFVQPGAGAIVLNRVVGASRSTIDGALRANGQVFLLNPNGVLFGANSRVDTAGLLVSTLGLSDADFLAGRMNLTASSTNGSIANAGELNAADGGYVALVGSRVRNDGTITARLGTVALASGDQVSLNFNGNSLVGVVVDKGTLGALVANGGAVMADGGNVVLTAKAASGLLDASVNNTGEIRAQTIAEHDGHILLLADGGTTTVGGVLDASAPAAGDGGAVETSGTHVKVQDGARITTASAHGLAGSWLVDPTDFTIAASGGDIDGATLSAQLASNNVTLQSSSGSVSGSGDINVDDTVTWSANTTLTLSAVRNININAAITSSGVTGALALEYGQGAVAASNTATYNVAAPVSLHSGSNFSTKLGSDGSVVNWTVITDLGAAADATTVPGTMTLQGIAANGRSGNFVLGADIDASATSGWNSGQGFSPIDPSIYSSWIGNFDGLGHTISNLYIHRPTQNSNDSIGLFGTGGGGSIRNVGLIDANVAGNSSGTGILLGSGGTYVYNSYSSGTVSGGGQVGGLVGESGGTVESSHSSATVTGTYNYIGGLVGTSTGLVDASYATGAVTGGSYVGGLVGAAEGSQVRNSYATGDVTATVDRFAGGLVGFGNVQYSGNTPIHSVIDNSYATGQVQGSSYVGGLVGGMTGMNVSNSYSTGNVTGTREVGGLLGGFSGGPASSLSNAFYDVDQVQVNGGWRLTAGGLYDAQYTDWISHSMTLSIANYASTLAPTTGDRYVVSTAQGLRDMLGFVEDNAANSFVLGADLTLPTGYNAGYFAGSFDGAGHTLSGLSLSYDNSNLGLFGYLPSSSTVIQNVGVRDASVSGWQYVGALVGNAANGATIQNSYSDGSVSGQWYVGGLVGRLHNGTVSQSYSAATVQAAGGYGGGLVGYSDGSSAISNSYATGAVQGSYSGGLVGGNYGTISNSYSTGAVTGSSYTGGLVGIQGGTATNSFYNADANAGLTGADSWYGVRADAAGTVMGLTTAQFQSSATFTTASSANGNVNPNWDLAGTWLVYDGHTAPLLRTFMTPLTVSVVSTKVYDATSGAQLSYSTTPDTSHLYGTAALSGSGKNVGTYTVTPSGLWSDQQGYILTYAPGTLTVTPATLTVTATGGTQVYDGTTHAQVTYGGNAFNGDSVTVSGTAALDNKNVGTGKAVAVSGLTLSGTDAGNYVLQSTTTTTTTNVTPATLTVTATGGTQVYDGTTTAQVAYGSNAISGDTIAITGAATMADKNVGSNKAVGVAGIAVSGTDAGNYVLQNTTASTTTTVTPATLVVTATGGTQVYDGTTTAQVTYGSNAIGGDTIAITGSATLADKNAGSNKAVGVTGIAVSGADAANYVLQGTTASTTTTVTPRLLDVTFTTTDKAFDGSTTATVTSTDDRVTGDQLTVGATANFADTAAGQNKAVTVTGVTLSGTDAGNYQVASASTSGVTGNIAQRTITYTLAQQSPTQTWTADGQVLVTAAQLDQVVVASWANTVAGNAPGQLAYTIWQGDQQVDSIKNAGTYQIRAAFADAAGNYLIASSGNQPLTITVAAAAASSGSGAGTGTGTGTGSSGTTTTTTTTSTTTASTNVAASAERSTLPPVIASLAPPASGATASGMASAAAMAPNVTTLPANVTLVFDAGTPLAIVSTPREGEVTTGVTLSEAQRMTGDASADGSGDTGKHDVRVPVSRNSLAQIVNGGVKLPSGVDQLLYVVKAQ